MDCKDQKAKIKIPWWFEFSLACKPWLVRCGARYPGSVTDLLDLPEAVLVLVLKILQLNLSIPANWDGWSLSVFLICKMEKMSVLTMGRIE